MNERSYRVSGIIKKNRIWIKKVMDVTAHNQKEAKEKAMSYWDFKSHLFHIESRRLRDDEEHLYNFWVTLR